MKTKKKLRIQLFDDEGFQVQDRLVEQDIELYQGPKDVHKGPMRIEVNLWEQKDIDGFIEYLKKMRGELPMHAPGKHKPKKTGSKIALEPQHREQILDYIKGLETQDKVIAYLREEGFEFVTYEYLESLELADKTGIIDKHKEKYQWMLKLVKKAKNPLNSKYDPTLCFGFKIVGKKLESFVIYLYGEKHSVQKKPWKDTKKLSFKNTEMINFPPYMMQEEKDKFRAELAHYRQYPEKKLSKFFKRWMKDVEFRNQEEMLKRAND